MKRKFIMMLVLIEGPKQPGNNIDVYLRPLVEELLQAWNGNGVRVWDEHKQEEFDLHALLLTASMIGLLSITIQDRQTRDSTHAHTV